jgi:hypothetical protein
MEKNTAMGDEINQQRIIRIPPNESKSLQEKPVSCFDLMTQGRSRRKMPSRQYFRMPSPEW